MSPLATSETFHEAECAEAAFALLIEKAATHTAKRALIEERAAFRRKLKERLTNDRK